MEHTVDGLLAELKRFAEDQRNTMDSILQTISNVVAHPEPERRILDAALYLAVGKMNYDNIGGVLRDISVLAQKRAEVIRDEKASREKG